MDIIGMFANIGLFALLFLLFGLLLVIVEMFAPGFGVAGTTGTIFLILGVIYTARTVEEGVFLILLIIAILGINLLLVLRSATKGKLNKSIILRDSLTQQEGYRGSEDLSRFLGQTGLSLTVLRPAGTGDFAGEKLDVVSEGGYIPEEAAIKVIKVEGRRVIVRQIEEK